MNIPLSFERIAETAGLIARHPDYPGKGRVVEYCSDEVDALARAGRITDEQRAALREILGVGGPPSASG